MKLKGKFVVLGDADQAFKVLGKHGYSLLVQSVHRHHRPGETWILSMTKIDRCGNRVFDSLDRASVPRGWWVRLGLCEPAPLEAGVGDVVKACALIGGSPDGEMLM